MRVVVTGASGQLGAYVVAELVEQGVEVVAWSGSATGGRSGVPLNPVDLTDGHVVSRALDAADPSAIIHLAAISSAAECYSDPERARAINVGGTESLADWCARTRRSLLVVSTDLVFAGDAAPYREDDPPAPTTRYGQTKQSGEQVAARLSTGVIVRLPLLFGRSRCGRPSFYDAALADLAEGRPRTFFGDEYRTPLHYATAAQILVRLAESEKTGIVHAAGVERVSRFDLMRRAAIAEGLDGSMVRSNCRFDAPGPEPRPPDTSLDTSRLASWLPGLVRPTIEQAIARF